ncbi:hypothetical protein E4U17_000674 [Claviceps sp. LM77 group G4]|nr:hypothetical protein E4U17_000674 [Claviceps sp. LM77 group G4]KAG6078688.1 hypothetical protein E4U16_001519 [Claviceps sp. LM84 group G4]
MSRLASPATGCHLRLVEVQVGHQVEKYNATTFDQPLEFSIQGQRPLGAGIGTLLLIISTGSKQMLSLRLNDILNHPCGTEEPITIDKRLHKICVRLPNLDHALRVWFQRSRDFLVSVCILRKTGFSIEETSFALAKYDPRPLDTNFMANRAPGFVHQASLFNITPLQARDAAPISLSNENSLTTHENVFDEKAKFLIEESYAPPFTKPNKKLLDANSEVNWATGLIQQPSPSLITSLKAIDEGSTTSISNEDSITSYGNIFDEVLDRLSQTGRKSHAISDWNFSTPNQPRDFNDMTFLHPCNVIPPNGTNSPSHPPPESFSHEKLDHRATSDSSRKHFFSEATDAPPFRRRHRYLTRSVSLAHCRLSTVNVNEEESSRSSRKCGNRTKSTLTERLGNSQNKVTSSFDSNQIVDFRDLMPHRRSLPFLESKQRAHKGKQLRIDEKSKPAPTRTPTNVSDRTGLQALSVQPVWQTAEMMTLLMQVSTLDELETKSSALYKQYEQDVADGLENENRAAFYLDSLENIRKRFWLDQLEKVGGSLYEKWARW